MAFAIWWSIIVGTVTMTAWRTVSMSRTFFPVPSWAVPCTRRWFADLDVQQGPWLLSFSFLFFFSVVKQVKKMWELRDKKKDGRYGTDQKNQMESKLFHFTKQGCNMRDMLQYVVNLSKLSQILTLLKHVKSFHLNQAIQLSWILGKMSFWNSLQELWHPLKSIHKNRKI